MSELLKGRKALVTGGTRGIGLAIVKTFIENGAEVCAWGVNKENGEKVASSFNGKMVFDVVDVGDFLSVKEGAKRFLERFGAIDILVNNAGIVRDALLMRLDEDQWNDVLRINLTSLYYTTSSFIRNMIKAKSGKVINMTSIVGLTGGHSGQTNYAASKAGIIGFSKSLSKEVGGKNINVNCIAPGFIETDMTSTLNEGVKERWLQHVSLSRLGSVEDVANVALFLASPLSSYVTGQVISVDGGWGLI